MHRYHPSGSWKQLPLAFNLMANPESASVLRMAYRQLELSRRLTFEQVMSNRALAIGVRNLAAAIARRRASGNATQSTPNAYEIAKDMDPVFEFWPEINYSGAEIGDR